MNGFKYATLPEVQKIWQTKRQTAASLLDLQDYLEWETMAGIQQVLSFKTLMDHIVHLEYYRYAEAWELIELYSLGVDCVTEVAKGLKGKDFNGLKESAIAFYEHAASIACRNGEDPSEHLQLGLKLRQEYIDRFSRSPDLADELREHEQKAVLANYLLNRATDDSSAAQEALVRFLAFGADQSRLVDEEPHTTALVEFLVYEVANGQPYVDKSLRVPFAICLSDAHGKATDPDDLLAILRPDELEFEPSIL